MVGLPDMHVSVCEEGASLSLQACCDGINLLWNRARLFRGALMTGRIAVEAAAQRAVVVGSGGVVALTDEVGDGRITQHTSAVGQRRATETQHLATGEPDVDRRGIARSHRLGARCDEGVQFILGQLPGAGVAAMIHQRNERRLAVSLRVGE